MLSERCYGVTTSTRLLPRYSHIGHLEGASSDEIVTILTAQSTSPDMVAFTDAAGRTRTAKVPYTTEEATILAVNEVRSLKEKGLTAQRYRLQVTRTKHRRSGEGSHSGVRSQKTHVYESIPQQHLELVNPMVTEDQQRHAALVDAEAELAEALHQVSSLRCARIAKERLMRVLGLRMRLCRVRQINLQSKAQLLRRLVASYSRRVSVICEGFLFSSRCCKIYLLQTKYATDLGFVFQALQQLRMGRQQWMQGILAHTSVMFVNIHRLSCFLRVFVLSRMNLKHCLSFAAAAVVVVVAVGGGFEPPGGEKCWQLMWKEAFCTTSPCATASASLFLSPTIRVLTMGATHQPPKMVLRHFPQMLNRAIWLLTNQFRVNSCTCCINTATLFCENYCSASSWICTLLTMRPSTTRFVLCGVII